MAIISRPRTARSRSAFGFNQYPTRQYGDSIRAEQQEPTGKAHLGLWKGRAGQGTGHAMSQHEGGVCWASIDLFTHY